MVEVGSALLRSRLIGQDGDVSVKLSLPGRHQVVVSLPEAGIEDLLPACEVLAQEGFLTWVVSLDAIEVLPQLVRSFGRRASLGIGSVQSPQQAREAVAAGAAFLTCDFLLPELVDTRSDLPVVLGGLTPSELRAGLAAGAAAVQVTPAGAYRGEVQALPAMLGFPALIASGTFGPDAARNWLDAGAVAVWPRGLIGTELVTSPSLGGLRTLLRDWRFDG